jgi:DNA-binding winged helix-turn-helix (wHTH) protein/Tol biopolymer transport system component
LDSSLKNPEINFNSGSELPPVCEFGEFQLHVGPRLLLKNGQQLPVRPKAVATLCVLAAQSGQVVTKDELMEKVWPDAVVEESNLAQYLHVLRKTLGTMPDGRPYIETLKRRGYRFNAPVLPSSRAVRNGSQRENGSTAPLAEPVPNEVRTGSSLSFLVAASIVVGFLLVVLFVAGATGWLSTRSVMKPSNEVIVTPLTSGENVTVSTISHNGKYLLYSDYDGERSRLVLQAVDRSSKSEILPRFEGPIGYLSFTPDDTEIFFGVAGKSAQEDGVYRISVNGGAPVRILETPTSPVSFSADGSKIVFIRPRPSDGRDQIVEASADGTGERVLLDAKDDQRLSRGAALSHSGQFVVFGSITRNFPVVCSLVKLDLNDQSIVLLTNEEWDSCYRIALASDDSGMAFVGTRRGDAFSIRRDQVYYLEFGQSESRRLTDDGNWHDPMSLGMTDAGAITALPLNRISQIWTVDQDGRPGTAVQITQGQSDGRGGIVSTSDGKIDFLARDGDGFAIFEADADGQDRRRVFGASTMQELRGTPGSGFLVFAEQQNDLAQLFRIDRNGSDRRQLTFGNSAKIDSSVSPDGKWVIYNDTAFDGIRVNQTLRRIPADGGPPEILSNEYCGVPHYSNNGRFISCSSDGKIRILSAETGQLVSELIAEGDFLTNSGARWSPDDTFLVYRVVKNGATNLWRQPMGGGSPRQLTRFPKGDIYNFSYASDGKKLYLSRGTHIRNAILIEGFR